MNQRRTPGAVCAFLMATGLLAYAGPAAAQTKTAQGTVTAVSARSMTVKVGGADMSFTIDEQTVVRASGAGTQTRREGGVKVADYIKTGGNVVVTYREANGSRIATNIRPVASAGGAPGEGSKTATGSVKTVSAASLTVTNAGKDMTFAVTRNTQVRAAGAGTATREAGGALPITGLVHAGDAVSVTYTEAGGAMTASAVRITAKAR
jgi:Domain of unknown function (DUF5666)